MCFSPQRRAIFRHRNFKKCSEDHSFLTFSLPNVLFATAACIFSTGEQQKVLRTWGVLYIFASKCAFHHSGVQFLIYPLTTWLRTRRFNRPTFRLTRHTNHRENTAFRDFSNIWRGCIFFLLTFALLHLLPSDLTACLVCFSTLHIVGSLLFKLPSTSIYAMYTTTSKAAYNYTSTQVDKNTSIQLEVVTWTYVLLKVVSGQDTWHSTCYFKVISYVTCIKRSCFILQQGGSFCR